MQTYLSSDELASFDEFGLAEVVFSQMVLVHFCLYFEMVIASHSRVDEFGESACVLMHFFVVFVIDLGLLIESCEFAVQSILFHKNGFVKLTHLKLLSHDEFD